MSVSLTKTRTSTVAAAVRALIPGAAIVRTTAVTTTRRCATRAELRYVALVLDSQGQALRIPPGATSRLVRILQAAYPEACWTGSLTWSAADGLSQLIPGSGGVRRVAA